MKKLLLCLAFFTTVANAATNSYSTGSAGGGVKLFKDILYFSSGLGISQLSVDPSVVATPADQGHVAISAAGIWLKNDNGTTTNWVNISPYGLPLFAKGSILTSNGVLNGEFTACADGEILEWDSAESEGVKCTTASSGGLSSVKSVAYTNSSFSSVNTWTNVPTVTITLTAGSNPVHIMGVCGDNAPVAGARSSGVGYFSAQNGSTNAAWQLVRDGTYVVAKGEIFYTGNRGCHLVRGVDTPTAGSHTYTLQINSATTNGVSFAVYQLAAIY